MFDKTTQALMDAVSAKDTEKAVEAIHAGANVHARNISGPSLVSSAREKPYLIAKLLGAGAKASYDHNEPFDTPHALQSVHFTQMLADALEEEDKNLAIRIRELKEDSEEWRALPEIYAKANMALTGKEHHNNPFPPGLSNFIRPTTSFADLRDALKEISYEQCRDAHDMAKQFSRYVILPALLLRADIVENNRALMSLQQKINNERHAGWEKSLEGKFDMQAGALLSSGKGLAEYIRFSGSWHEEHHAFPSDRLRPLAVRGKWHALTIPKSHVIPEGEAKGWQIVVLTTGKELQEETNALKHCVGEGDYALKCCRGDAHIISIRDPAGTIISTVELDGKLNVVQHKAMENAAPPRLAKMAADYIIGKIKAGSIKRNRECGDTQESEAIQKEPELLRDIGYRPNWDTVDAVLKHYQKTVTIKKAVKTSDEYLTPHPHRLQFRMEGVAPYFWRGENGNVDGPIGAKELLERSGIIDALDDLIKKDLRSIGIGHGESWMVKTNVGNSAAVRRH